MKKSVWLIPSIFVSWMFFYKQSFIDNNFAFVGCSLKVARRRWCCEWV